LAILFVTAWPTNAKDLTLPDPKLIRSLLLCGDRDIDIHRLRDWHGLAIASGPQALKLVKRFVETSLKNGFVTGELTKCIALFRVGIERASKEDFFPVAFTSGAI
jgi:hypothetical protein